MASSPNVITATAGVTGLTQIDPKVATAVSSTTIKFATFGECFERVAAISPVLGAGMQTLEQCESIWGAYQKNHAPAPVETRVEYRDRIIEVPAGAGAGGRSYADPLKKGPAAAAPAPVQP